MATADTVYRIVNEYEVRDKGSTRGVRQIGKEIDATAAKGLGLKRILLGLGSVLGARAIFGIGKKTLIDFNSGLEQAKIQTAALLKINLGGSFAGQMQNATKLVGELQDRAAKSTATTEEMVEFMSRIAGPATRAGLAVKDLAEFTSQSVVAAKLFGEEATAGLDIKQALTSQVTIRDRFANQLLNIVNVEKEAFNQLNPNERLKLLQTALRSPAIGEAAGAQATSFAGITSTLKDNLQIALGKIGLPLMKEMGKAAKEFVEFLKGKEGTGELAQFAKDFSSALVTAFKVAKSMFGFIASHKTLLLTLAKAVIISKAGGMLGSALGGVGGLAGAARGGVNAIGGGIATVAGVAFKGLGKFLTMFDSGSKGLSIFGARMELAAGQLSKFSGVLGVAVLAALGLAEFVKSRQEKEIGGKVAIGSIQDQLAKADALAAKGDPLAAIRRQRLVDDLKKQGIVSKGGDLDFSKLSDLAGGGLSGGILAAEVAKGIEEAIEAAQAADRGQANARRQEAQTKGMVDGLGMLGRSLPGVSFAADRLREAIEADTMAQAQNLIKLGEAMGLGIVAAQFKNAAQFAGKGLKRLNRQPVNVKIEIPARDPGLFAREFNNAMERVVARPSAANAILGAAF